MLQCLRSGVRLSSHCVSSFIRSSAGVSSGSQYHAIQPEKLHLHYPTLLIIGRPNVGKSTLFNRLTGKRAALVYDTPGSHVTRDYKESMGKLSDLSFSVVDTSGLEPSMPSSTIQGRATRLTQKVCCRLKNMQLRRRAHTYTSLQ